MSKKYLPGDKFLNTGFSHGDFMGFLATLYINLVPTLGFRKTMNPKEVALLNIFKSIEMSLDFLSVSLYDCKIQTITKEMVKDDLKTSNMWFEAMNFQGTLSLFNWIWGSFKIKEGSPKEYTEIIPLLRHVNALIDYLELGENIFIEFPPEKSRGIKKQTEEFQWHITKIVEKMDLRVLKVLKPNTPAGRVFRVMIKSDYKFGEIIRILYKAKTLPENFFNNLTKEQWESIFQASMIKDSVSEDGELKKLAMANLETI